MECMGDCHIWQKSDLRMQVTFSKTELRVACTHRASSVFIGVHFK